MAGTPLGADSMRLYLHARTALLAVVSELGPLYVQDFPDAAAVAAVDQFEGLATGLSGKIRQKLMILERMPAGPRFTAVPVGLLPMVRESSSRPSPPRA